MLLELSVIDANNHDNNDVYNDNDNDDDNDNDNNIDNDDDNDNDDNRLVPELQSPCLNFGPNPPLNGSIHSNDGGGNG